MSDFEICNDIINYKRLYKYYNDFGSVDALCRIGNIQDRHSKLFLDDVHCSESCFKNHKISDIVLQQKP